MGNDLLEVVKESRRVWNVSIALNATFISLIPKSDKPDSFGGFRPIALCSLVYKIITKIIATRLKKSSSIGISKEQFGLLDGRQITDSIEVVQEVLHSIKVKNLKELVLKLDWGFLRLVLL